MKNEDAIKNRIEVIDAEISDLRDEKSLLQKVALLESDPDDTSKELFLKAKRQRGKLLTLYQTRIYFSAINRPSTIKPLLNYFEKSFKDKRNHNTLRSHLRRLRDDGQLCFNPQTKKWSLPSKKD